MGSQSFQIKSSHPLALSCSAREPEEGGGRQRDTSNAPASRSQEIHLHRSQQEHESDTITALAPSSSHVSKDPAWWYLRFQDQWVETLKCCHAVREPSQANMGHVVQSLISQSNSTEPISRTSYLCREVLTGPDPGTHRCPL